jgi:deoxyribodipyrimidine photo-lyase
MKAARCRGGRGPEAQGIDAHSYLDQLLFKPGSVLTKTGSYFQVFSQFRKVCYERLHRSVPRLVSAPRQAPLNIISDPIPAQVKVSIHPASIARPVAGR